LDIELNDEQRILLISGPNAGGKSVCLKTVGLLQYMLQCGLLVPVYGRSRTGVFKNILIDIGDEQSIENDLSTYSSHLLNMKQFDRHADNRSLLLIDEFGSGTEPQIGGALAEALLERFNEKGAYGVITTHYQNLKHFAEATAGIVNGAMLYDRHKMQPLFMLSVGRPGSSFAVEIARKTGLPDAVIRKASEIVGTDYINMDKYLQDIVRDKRYWETKRDNIRKQEKKIEEMAATYEHNLETADKQRKEIMRTAKTEAASMLAEANARIENTIREIKQSQADKEKTRLARQALEEFKANALAVDEADDRITREMEKIKKRQSRKKEKTAVQEGTKTTITTGDAVQLDGQSSAGTVISVNGDEATVAFGMIKSIVKLSKLHKVSRSQLKKEIRKSTFVSEQTMADIRERKLNFKQDIDVRGMRGDEAIQAVTYFVDDAILVGVSPVRILHGTGTGALRQIIRDYLSGVSGVRRYRDEHVQLGGAGITVVELE
jgi:DNA mismatch repair protein MutS2